jgi:hypothetical protein
MEKFSFRKSLIKSQCQDQNQMDCRLTPRGGVLLKKVMTIHSLTLIKKLPGIHWTQRFITAFIKPRHSSLFRAAWNQSTPETLFHVIHFNIIIPSTPTSSEWSFSFRMSNKNISTPIFTSVTGLAHLFLLDYIAQMTFEGSSGRTC